MSETATGEVGKITTGEEAGQDYECRFALKDVKGLFFVWDPETEGIELLEAGATLRITHDGSKYKKVEKIEKAGQETQETPKKQGQEKQAELPQEKGHISTDPPYAKPEQDSQPWRIARTSATERVFGNGAGPSDIPDEVLIELFEKADKIATYIVTGKVPEKKK